jgi:6-phosphogluconolactonase
MKEQTYPDPESVAARAAEFIAETGRRAVAERGRFLLALSGGSTPARMLRRLADERLDWPAVHVFQVDERVAPDGHKDRNITQLREILIANLPSRPAGFWTMPVSEEDAEIAAENYGKLLRSVAGDPPVLDLVHLGLGDDGHTASLVPGDDVLGVSDRDVATTADYNGRQRITLTYPLINRARSILWIITGASKGPALARLRRGDRTIPASGISRGTSLVLSDGAAFEASMQA